MLICMKFCKLVHFQEVSSLEKCMTNTFESFEKSFNVRSQLRYYQIENIFIFNIRQIKTKLLAAFTYHQIENVYIFFQFKTNKNKITCSTYHQIQMENIYFFNFKRIKRKLLAAFGPTSSSEWNSQLIVTFQSCPLKKI